MSGYIIPQGTLYKRSTLINEGDIRRGNNDDSLIDILLHFNITQAKANFSILH